MKMKIFGFITITILAIMVFYGSCNGTDDINVKQGSSSKSKVSKDYILNPNLIHRNYNFDVVRLNDSICVIVPKRDDSPEKVKVVKLK